MKHSLYPLGKIAKTRGYAGELVMVFDQAVSDDIEEIDEVFVLIDGLQTPFPVQKMVTLTDSSALLKMEFVDSQEDAQIVTGCSVYSAEPLLQQKTKTESEKWIGFAVSDSKHGKIGVVKRVEDYKGNVVMRVMDGDKEILISVYPELIIGIDNDAKVLSITAPDGYFSD